MSEPRLVLKWATRYGVLEVDTFAKLDDALRAAKSASDDGMEALDHIEVIRLDGSSSILTASTCLVMADERFPDPLLSSPPPAAMVEIKSAAGRVGRYEVYETVAQAEAAVNILRPILGDRVLVRRLNRDGSVPL